MPWFNNKIKSLIRKKNKAHRNFKYFNNDKYKKSWHETRTKVRKEIKKSHNTYVNEIIGDIKEDPRPFWRYINNQKADKQEIPPLAKKNKEMAETDQEKAETFNNQFTSVFTTTQLDSIPYERNDSNIYG